MTHTDNEKCILRLKKWRGIMIDLKPGNFSKASITLKIAQMYAILPTGGTIMAISTALLLYELRRHHFPAKHRYKLACRLLTSSTIGMLPFVGMYLIYKYDANIRNIDQVIELLYLENEEKEER